MARIGKYLLSLLAVILAVSSLILVIPTKAQTIPKPSVPEFNVQFIDSSYNTTDQNTGQSEHVVNGTIQITIKNQPFVYSFNDTTYYLYYNLRTKETIDGNWDIGDEKNPILYLPDAPPYNMTSVSHSFYVWDSPPSQSHSDYTTVSYPWQSDPYLPSSGYTLDFQVEAIVGHDSQRWVVEHPLNPTNGGYYESAIAYDADSGWSSTQTINLADGSTTNPTPFPSVPEFSWLTILPLLVCIPLVLIMVKKRLQGNIATV